MPRNQKGAAARKPLPKNRATIHEFPSAQKRGQRREPEPPFPKQHQPKPRCMEVLTLLGGKTTAA